MKKFCAVLAAGALALIMSPSVLSANADTFVETYREKNNLIAAPSVVATIESKADFERYLGEQTVRPASLILPLDGEGNVIAGGESIGSLGSVYAQIKYDTLAVAEVNGTESAEALVSIWKQEIDTCDFAVMSKDAELLKQIRKELPSVRGVYDCRGIGIGGGEDLYGIVKDANLSMANVVVLSEEQSSVENVEYLQYRFKSVWTWLDGDCDEFDVFDAVATGAFGLVTDSVETVYRAYAKYPKRSLSRASANVAHRGLPVSCAENSLDGGLRAIEAGATHLEIDVYLTKDGVPVIMHDSTIDRTTGTNGNISVESLTLEQLKQYKIRKTYLGTDVAEPQPIPTVEEVLAALDGKDVVLILEIKTGNAELFPALIPIVEKYDFYDQLVFISFNDGMLLKAHELMPEVPTAYLGSLNPTNFEESIAKYNRYNMVVDTTSPSSADFTTSTLKDRGYAGWYWTFSGKGDSVTAIANGAFGITNNMADAVGELVWGVSGAEGQKIKKEGFGEESEISVRVVTYAGEEKIATGTVFAVRDCGDHAEVVAMFNENAEFMHFTRAFRVDYAGAAGASNGLQWWGIMLVAIACGVVVAGGAAATAILFKKKKNGCGKNKKEQ